MAHSNSITVRPIERADKHRLANLLHFEKHVHTHLDWRSPSDWIGREPFLVLDSGGRLEAAIALPPDPPGVAWLRLFAVSSRFAVEDAWQLLWEAAEKNLKEEADIVIAIPIQSWTQSLLKESGFEHTHDVVVLDWTPEYGLPENGNLPFRENIRQMEAGDLKHIFEIDRKSFPSLWQNSHESIQFAFGQASHATVIEKDGRICGYQLSTQNPHGLHLARLAVDPEFQGQHMAIAMVEDLQETVSKLDGQRLTVNTQGVNKPSLALYKKAYFKTTDDNLPVFEKLLNQTSKES